MFEIRIDRDACLGYANCVLVAPDVFRIDADGIAVTTRNPAGADSSEHEAIRSAAYDCPTTSIELVEIAAG